MSLTLRVVPRLALLAALLVVPSAVMAQEENPRGLGSPNMTDNSYLDPNIYGGDAGSPWPVSIRAGRGSGLWTQSIPPSAAPKAAGAASVLPASTASVPWLEPALALLPGTLPQLLWLPHLGLPAGIGANP